MNIPKWTTKYREYNYKMRNKNGSLSMYAFACGYIEQWSNGLNINQEGIFHVKGNIKGFRVWETFDNIVDARRFAKTQLV